MSTTFAPTTLGRTGLTVGRLGLSSGYKMPTAAVERAFAAGMNYLYWGSLRRADFARAIQSLKRQRERMVLVVQSYVPLARLVRWSLERALRQLGVEHTDVLLLGMWNRPLPPRVLDEARRLKERGLVRFLGISTHHRPLVPELAPQGAIDVFHVRYNAVHSGAERDVFPHLSQPRPGMVAFTATSWRQLLDPKRTPKGERTPTAGDCYRYVLSQPAIDVCMTGLTSLEQTEHALAALEKGPMNDEELAWMRRVGDAIYGKPRQQLRSAALEEALEVGA